MLTVLSDTSKTIAYKRADKTARQYHVQAESKLTRLQRTKTKRHKTDENWFKNISIRPLKTKRNATISLRTETFYYTEPYTDRRYCIEC